MVELVIVLMIIAVLGWIIYPAYQGYITRMKIVQAITDITEMAETIHDQEVRTGVLGDGLDDAVDPKTGISLGYDKRVDPWGFPYQYKNLRTLSNKGNGNARQDKNLKPVNSDFDLYSFGPDGQSSASITDAKSRDDVLRARDGGFYGTAVDFDP